MPSQEEFFEYLRQQAAAQEQAIDQYHAISDDFSHMIENLLQTISIEHLEVLVKVYANHARAGKALKTDIAGALADMVRVLSIRKNVCAACGKNHDEMLAEMMAGEKPVDLAKPTEPTVGQMKAMHSEADAEEAAAQQGESKAEMFGMERNPDYGIASGILLEGADTVHPWRCKRCHKGSISLADRALKPPKEEGCEGCQHISKFGGRYFS